MLTFWKKNRTRYPELSLMTRDLLSIPIGTVASESAFSVGGRVIGKYQSSILLENAEAKLCSRDWIYRHQACDDSAKDEDIAIDVDCRKTFELERRSIICYFPSFCAYPYLTGDRHKHGVLDYF